MKRHPLIVFFTLLIAACAGSPTPQSAPTPSKPPSVPTARTQSPAQALSPTPISLPVPTATVHPALFARVGQLGGASNAVATGAHYAFLNVGPRLVIFDIANPSQPVLVGQSPPLPGFEGMAVAGDYAYVATGVGGLSVIDVQDPALPSLVASYATQERTSSVEVVRNIAYLAAADGLHILDVSKPTAPTSIGSFATPDAILDVTLVGDHAFLAEAYSKQDPVEKGGLRIVNVSDPAHPQPVGFLPMNPTLVGEFDRPNAPRGGRSVAVAGNRAYATYRTSKRGGLWIADVSDPAHPKKIGEFQDYIPYVSDVSVVVSSTTESEKTYAYLATGLNAGLLVLDVTHPEKPAVLPDKVTGLASDTALAGDRLVIADASGGLKIADISNPEDPVQVGSYEILGDARGVKIAGARAYVTDSLRKLWVVDITDPTRPLLLGSFSTPGSIKDIAIAGTRLYIAAETAGLHIVDMVDPRQPLPLSTYKTPGLANSVAVSGAYAYVADGKIQILDVSDPSNPVLAASHPGWGRTDKVVIADKVAYVADQGLHILDLLDPVHPQPLGLVATSSVIQDLVVVGNRLTLLTPGSLSAFDLSDLARPRPAGSAAVPEGPGHIALGRDSVYVVGSSQLQVFGSSGPDMLTPAQHYDELAYGNGIALAGEYAFVADGPAGLVVLR